MWSLRPETFFLMFLRKWVAHKISETSPLVFTDLIKHRSFPMNRSEPEPFLYYGTLHFNFMLYTLSETLAQRCSKAVGFFFGNNSTLIPNLYRKIENNQTCGSRY